jgi:hypothetical protein
MTSFRRIVNGKLGDVYGSDEQFKPEDMVSYYNHLMGVRKNLGPAVRFSYRSAKGTAYFMANVPGIGYEIRVNGEYKDVQVVIKKFEDSFGATDLNPKLGLPDNLKAPIERIKYLINWIKTGKN